jgi:hypothetical protein
MCTRDITGSVLGTYERVYVYCVRCVLHMCERVCVFEYMCGVHVYVYWPALCFVYV